MEKLERLQSDKEQHIESHVPCLIALLIPISVFLINKWPMFIKNDTSISRPFEQCPSTTWIVRWIVYTSNSYYVINLLFKTSVKQISVKTQSDRCNRGRSTCSFVQIWETQNQKSRYYTRTLLQIKYNNRKG